MKLKPIAFLASVLFIAASCSNEEKKPEAKATLPPASFDVLMIRHPVASFEAWKPHYFGHDSVRKNYGLTHYHIGVSIEDTNQIIVFNKINDAVKVKEFVALPELKDVMQKAGVSGSPVFDYVHTIRSDSTPPTIKDRLMIKHKVKDFDVWLKVFDAEGMDTRRSFGIIDRGLARGMDDPNMVYIIFAIEDWAKANVRMNSEEIKKIMTDAGVEGTPVFIKYKLIDSNPFD